MLNSIIEEIVLTANFIQFFVVVLIDGDQVLIDGIHESRDDDLINSILSKGFTGL